MNRTKVKEKAAVMAKVSLAKESLATLMITPVGMMTLLALSNRLPTRWLRNALSKP